MSFRKVTLYGVWITEKDGTGGRWLKDTNDSQPWFGPEREAQQLADERIPVWRMTNYKVKPKPVSADSIRVEKGRVLDRLNEVRAEVPFFPVPSSQWNTYCPVCGQGPFKHACGTSCEGGKCTVLNHCKPKCTCGLPDNEPCKVHGDKIYKEEDPCTCLEQPGALCPRCHKGIGR